MPSEPIRVAVVGTGAWWGHQHARVWSQRDDAQLCAIVGRTQGKTLGMADRFGVPGYTDLQLMLEQEAPDLVSLSLPNEHHFEGTMEVIEAGIPLLAEKPLVFDLDQADALLEAAQRRDLFFAINFNHRYARPVQMAAQALRAGQLGDVVFATWRFGGEAGTSAHPHANLIETQCHGLDMLEHLCGPITSVAARMTDMTGKGYATVAVALGFAAGGVGSLVGSYDTSYAYPGTHLLEVNGTQGRVLVEDTVGRFTLSRVGQETRQVWEAGYFNDEDRAFHTMFDRHLDELVPAFLAGAPPPVHARAGRRALELAHAVIESYETDRIVHLA